MSEENKDRIKELEQIVLKNAKLCARPYEFSGLYNQYPLLDYITITEDNEKKDINNIEKANGKMYLISRDGK